ncbi:MAG: AMP-binding protein, partial [Planctomycetes bacterium]|nr:AMP-binding protein [Planctomycetota bacterium]
MNKLLWEPSEKTKKQANMTRFVEFINERHAMSLVSYDDLYQWSIENIPEFWAAVWEFTEIKSSSDYDVVIDDIRKFPGAKWFEGSRLNYAENLLRHRDDHLAFIFRGENLKSGTMTYEELYDSVARVARSLRDMGIKPGDRVAAYMPNLMETVIAMLASTSIGAVWSSCATDLGAQAVLDRIGQIEPKVLFTVDGYYYKGKPFSSLSNAKEIAEGIPSLEKVVVVRYAESETGIDEIPNSVYYDEFVSKETGLEITFEQLPFSHPVVVMFSSGTTGKPKCIVQSAGGILINQRKELMIHADLKREDRILYVTTCSWMMWNWLMSSLGLGATVVLYEGNALYPHESTMWELIQN